jgi:hypothetical protein
MALPLRERLTQALMPAALYYRSRIADEATWGEHELDVLGRDHEAGGTAIDAGANQVVFAYAFSRIANHVEAFEPNPDYARFAQRMLASAPACISWRCPTRPAGRSSWCRCRRRHGAASGRQPGQCRVYRRQGRCASTSSCAPSTVFAFKDVAGDQDRRGGAASWPVLAGARETILRDARR